MRPFRIVFAPTVRLLARSLGRLGRTLHGLHAQLHHTVAVHVGETVGGMVQEVIQALGHPPLPPAAVPGHRGRPPRTAPPQEPEEPLWFPEPDDGLLADGPETESGASPPAEPGPPATRCARALAVGLQTTCGWLRQGTGRRPVLTALGLGFLTGLAVYIGGPLAAAGMGVAGAALGLVTLADTVQVVADGLAAWPSK
jgi:hypothetical protein